MAKGGKWIPKAGSARLSKDELEALPPVWERQWKDSQREALRTVLERAWQELPPRQARDGLPLSRNRQARLLLGGELVKGPKGLPHHRFPKRGSAEERECHWALADELLLIAAKRDLIARRLPKESGLHAALDLLQQVAGLFVPDDDHGLAHPYRKARLGNRLRAPFRFDYAHDAVAAAVKAAQEDGLGKGDAVDRVSDHYREVSREYLYRLLRKPKQHKPKRLAPKRSEPKR
jgi:hypothetical protein